MYYLTLEPSMRGKPHRTHAGEFSESLKLYTSVSPGFQDACSNRGFSEY